MARTWLFNSRGIAKKVKNATQFSSYQIKELGANRECPNCKYTIDNSDVSLEWPGLPAGVKFDPTDEELLDHLAGKVGLGNSKSHMFIDEFIPTLEGVEGICYTHPENLPGAKKDGNSVHFFYTAHNAYATGHRKRRKINSHCSLSEENVRWHKTGKTKPVVENGMRKGWKKIMVLYRSMEKGCRPDSAKWVMHQYHLGTEEEEEDGEMVVSKIFYQIKQSDKTGIASVNEEEHGLLNAVKYSPRTPNPNAPQRPRFTGQSPLFEACENKVQYSPVQDEVYPEAELPVSGSSTVHQIDEGKNPVWWAGESQAVEEPELNTVDESLRCHEVLDYYPPGESSFGLSQHDLSHDGNEKPERKTSSTVGGFPELDDIVMDTPPDFLLSDLNFGSQDSITSWLDRL